MARLIFLIALLFGSSAVAQAEMPFGDRACVTAPFDRLCPDFPHDQTDFSAHFEYMVLVKGAQDPFDAFSWQAFVALNWPETGEFGEAPEAARVWQSFARRSDLRGKDRTCVAPAGALLIDSLAQADQTVLIDQAGNFTVYDVRLNPTAAAHLSAMSDAGALDFPQGSLGPDGQTASILVKTAWRVLPQPDDRFFARPGVIAVPAHRSETGQAECHQVQLGMVGMHIVTRTGSGNGDEWIWSTFEHRLNAPDAANARDVNSIYSRNLFPGGCAAPVSTAAMTYFNPDCLDCLTNSAPSDDWAWAAKQPFARIGGRPAVPSQIVRCWKIFSSTAEVNATWAQRLKGTVWSNYMLISAQWRGANKSPLFEHGEVPRFLTNVTMESYIQDARNGTCLGCHATAVTADGRDGNFTFLLSEIEE